MKPLIWAEVDLGAIAHNVRELRRLTRPQARVMAMVKANGYGHGALEVARTALANGAEWLGVARLAEGIHLRENGCDAPILVFSPTLPADAGLLIDFGPNHGAIVHCVYRVTRVHRVDSLLAFIALG